MATLDRREFLGVAAGLCLASQPITCPAGQEVYLSYEELDAMPEPVADDPRLLCYSVNGWPEIPATVFQRLCAHRRRMGRMLEPEEVARFARACSVIPPGS